MADIVFLIDKSASAGSEADWIGDFVSRVNGLDAQLRSPSHNIDPRYGLVGFGDAGGAYGHSHLLDVNDSNADGDKLFGNAAQLASVAQNVESPGSYELVWDSIEHAVAEYEFRPGAAVIFVAFRRDDMGGSFDEYYVGNEPRNAEQQEHTRVGTLASLKSYNVTLNTVVEAQFDQSLYSTTGGIVLGVEADRTDNVLDGRQIAHIVNPVADQPTPSDALLVSHNGANSGTYVDSGKSIRVSTAAAPTIAGPSVGNYRAEQISYAFEDISGTGTAITNWDQYNDFYKELTPSNLGNYSFGFYGDTYTSLFVNTDGSITFDGPSDQFESEADWSDTPLLRPRIAPLWDQFDVNSEPFDVYWQVKNSGQASERLVVQWSGMNYANDSGFGSTETVTFQAVLYANGDIVFNYQDVDVSDPLFTDGKESTALIGTNEFLYPNVVPAGVFIDRVHAIDQTQFYGVEDDFVRLAWETGGAAWNNEVISSGPSSTYAAAFDTAFIASIAKQIKDKHARGEVAFADSPILQVNMGGPASGAYIADTHSSLGLNFLPAGTTTLSSSQAVLRNGNSMAGDANTLNVFKTAREMQNGDLDLNVPATLVPDGRYVVELMFASFEENTNFMQVFFEGGADPYLDHYIIRNDSAKIPANSSGSPEYEVVPDVLGDGVPIVKRYSVDVTGGNGLQIKLKTIYDYSPIISGLRVLKSPPPRVENVVISGSTWDEGVKYAFDDLVNAGQQLRPIPTQNADALEIHFDGPVSLTADALTVAKTIRNTSGPNATPINSYFLGNAAGVTFNYDPVNYIARWTFPAVNDPQNGARALVDGKYAIFLNASLVKGASGQSLNGDWLNGFGFNPSDPTKPTADKYSDDPARAFVTGDGTANSAGTNFRLNFALLAGDYNGDGIVTTTAVSGGPVVDVTAAGDRWTDGNGDGVTSVNNTADLAVRDAVGNAGDYLPLRRLANGAGFYGADLKDDDHVDGGDLAIWKTTFGTGGNGDISGDGVTDGTDLLIWQTLFGSYSAWSPYPYPGAPTAASTASLLSAPPRVTNVIISGSTSYHAPFAMDGVDGSGAQLQTVPVGGADTISIVFDQAMNIAAEHLIVVGLRTFNLPELVEFSYDAATFTATWHYEGWALGDQYLLALSDMATSVEGNWLDGEWTNPATTTTVNSLVSEFPSGDGNAGGAFKFVITLLPGDANLNGLVDGADYLIWQQNWAADGAFIEGDFAGDGIVGPEDYDWWQANNGVNLQQLSLRADFDGDFDVDAADLNVIGTNAGMTTGATWANGDLDGDGDVDMDDLDLAFAQFGQALSVVS